MNTAIIYTSNTGFTKTYAEWFAGQLGCEARPLEGLAAGKLAEFDLVVYGGWVEGGKINGLADMQAMLSDGQNLMVYAVGALPTRSTIEPYLMKKNGITKVQFAYLEGGFRYEDLSEGKKMALNMYKDILTARKQDTITEQERFFIHNIGRSFDHSDLEPALKFLAAIREAQ